MYICTSNGNKILQSYYCFIKNKKNVKNNRINHSTFPLTGPNYQGGGALMTKGILNE